MSEISLPKTIHIITRDDDHHELFVFMFLFLYHTTIDYILIVMVYVYNFKGFTGETVIS